ncbi:MAG: 2-oxo acid dehydrogenase subunit E2, partial [Planctomycetales bacterium]|nr:2-oxo acid dehydrogenase subunit E2 [Planctomycetales bacterium]
VRRIDGPASVPIAAVSPGVSTGRSTRVPLRGMRRMIAENLTQARNEIPHVSLIDECNVTDLVKLRASLKETCAMSSIKLTYLAFFVRAAVAALKAEPLVNSSLDDEAGEIILHHDYHIGIACATPQGLLVPVIRNADQKGIFEIAREIDALGTEAKAGRSQYADLHGGTFTITSIGNIGGLISTPIIRRPEVAIMGVGKILKRPIYDEHDRIVPANLVYLSFSFDHRVIDGDVAARFSRSIIRQLEHAAALLLPPEATSARAGDAPNARAA